VTIRPKADKPRPGQESVWDYPRPPRLETFAGSITVELGGNTVASTSRAWRVLETTTPAAPGSRPARVSARQPWRASPNVSRGCNVAVRTVRN
jgi:uncharacterized protein (DUF427 family)